MGEGKSTDVRKIVVTGAAGYLGGQLVPALVAEGFDVTGVDLAEPASAPEGVRIVRADLSDSVAAGDAVRGADLVVHCASVHPWKAYTDDVYLDANVKATWHLYAAAATASVGRVVLTSSIAAAGYGFDRATWPVTEERQGKLYDLYSVTKHAQEDIARSFADRGEVRTIALRPPAFFPVKDEHLGFWLTGAYSTCQDVVSAHVAAVRVMAGRQTPRRPLGSFEAMFITNRLPYTSRDADLCEPADRVGPRIVQRHWPDAAPYLVEHGYTGAWLPAVYDTTKARELLGWQSTYGFDEWWAAERRKNAAKTGAA